MSERKSRVGSTARKVTKDSSEAMAPILAAKDERIRDLETRLQERADAYDEALRQRDEARDRADRLEAVLEELGYGKV